MQGLLRRRAKHEFYGKSQTRLGSGQGTVSAKQASPDVYFNSLIR